MQAVQISNGFPFASSKNPAGFRAKRQRGVSPSRSSQKAILVWPRPMVYLPVLTPSNFSSSDCSTYYQSKNTPCQSRVSFCFRCDVGGGGAHEGGKGEGRPLVALFFLAGGVEGYIGGVARITYLAGEVNLGGLDADVLGSGSHRESLVCVEW